MQGGETSSSGIVTELGDHGAGEDEERQFPTLASESTGTARAKHWY